MELTKKDTQMIKGLAIVFMVVLHLFCRTSNLPYTDIMIKGSPLSYYFGLFCDSCVVIFAFCSGYALYLMNEKTSSAKEYYKKRLKSILSFLINYWIILVAFSIIGLCVGDNIIPSSVGEFFKHFFLLSNAYNGAWWYVLIYILLVLLSRPLFLLIKKVNFIIVNLAVVAFYFVAYIQRFNTVVMTNIEVLDWIILKIALLGTALLPFAWGMYFFKYKLFTKTNEFLHKKLSTPIINLLMIALLLAVFVGHSIYKSLIVAPVTGVATILVFITIQKPKFIEKIFEFFGEHSTNIWLTHMFFYFVLFENLVFVAKYPIFIFVFMMAITLAVSYVINLIYNPIKKLIK